MATDTTELTFVRCPECRSLVPAMSTRCRMCGAGLGTELKPDSGNTPPSSATGRVRQKTTTTASASDFNEQVKLARADEVAPPVEKIAKTPLDEFLDEDDSDLVETSPEPVEQAVEEKAAQASSAADEDEFDDFDELDDIDDIDDFEDFDDFDEPAEAVEEAYEAVETAPAAPVVEVKAETPSMSPKKKLDSATLEEAQKKVESMGVTPQPKQLESKPRVVVEQGRGKFSKGLSFGAPNRFDAKQKPEQKVEQKVEPKKMEQRVEQKVAPKVEVPVEPVEIFEPEVNEQVIEQEVEMKPQMKEAPVDPIVEAPAARPRVAQAMPTSKEGAKDAVKRGEQLGRIFGWLVSYVDSNGSSIELREGRFFVSSTQLRNTDLVLEDDTISTPHAMFTIGTDTGILIQDLKSDRGIFVRTADATAYRREYDTVVLQHGDWVRFGDLEFLVSVIAHVGAR